jgi:LPXTG-motif cell wall-anchored protein
MLSFYRSLTGSKAWRNLWLNTNNMNWPVIIIVGLFLILLLVFLIRRNQKDEQEFEQQLNNDFHKIKDAEGDVDSEEVVK